MVGRATHTCQVLRRYLWIPISAALLAFVVVRTRPWDIGDLGLPLDPLPLLLALALDVPVVLLWAVRSRSLMAGIGFPLTLRDLVPIVSFANTISNLTPASAGEALRAWVLRDRHGVPLTSAAAVILVERLWAVGIMAVTASGAAVIALTRPTAAVGLAISLLALACCFAPSMVYRLRLRPGRALERLLDSRAARRSAETTSPHPATPGRGLRLLTGLVELDRTLAHLVSDPRRSVVFVSCTLGVFACYAAQLSLLLGALGQSVSPEGAWGALGLATVAGVLSALPFGLGAADVVLAAILGQLGVAAAVIGAVVLLLRATATLPLGVAGAISWSSIGCERHAVRDDVAPASRGG